MDHEAEVIKQEMLETRSSLTEKLEALEEQVASTVRSTTEAVTGTAGAVKDAVENTVGTVSDSVKETVESVKETFDLSRQMENHPWLMLGGALTLGYLGACLLSGRSSFMPSVSRSPTSPARQPAASNGPTWTDTAAQGGSGIVDKLAQAFKPTFDKLEGLAIGAATGVVGDMILNAAPEALRTELKPMLDELTTHLGGKPVQGLWEQFLAGHKDQPQDAQR